MQKILARKKEIMVRFSMDAVVYDRQCADYLCGLCYDRSNPQMLYRETSF